MGTITKLLCIGVIGIASALCTSVIAQSNTGSPRDQVQTYQRVTLEYSKPQFVMGLNSMSGMVGSFQCTAGDDVVAQVSVDAGQPDNSGHNASRLLLLIIRPDGSTTSLPWQSVPGYSRVYPPRRVFASDDSVYAFVMALENKPLDAGSRPLRVPLVLKFDDSGTLKNVVRLATDTLPVSFGVFPSGNLLVVSKDRLNSRMRLQVLKSNGDNGYDLPLGDNDYTQHHGATADGPQGEVSFSADFLVGATDIYSRGQNLLLVPIATATLPVLEVSESGIVRSVVPRLPKGSVIAGFVPSTGSNWNIRLGGINDSTYSHPDSSGTLGGASMKMSTLMAEFSPNDGSLVRELDLGAVDVYPACAEPNQYTLFTGHYEDGQLQIVEASPR
jgi:hypothetical protein